MLLLLRDSPKYESLLAYSKRYKNVQIGAIETYLQLLRVASDVLDLTEQYFSGQGTSQGRFTVLCLLNRHPETPLCPADLAARSGVTRATMTGLLQGLEGEGLIKRSAAKNDKRMLLVELTSKGRKFLDHVLPDLFRRIGELMEGINDRDRKTLIGLLDKVSLRTGAIKSSPQRAAA